MPHNGHIEGNQLPVEQVVDMALQSSCQTIACTYTEPTIYFEYAYDIAVKATEFDIKTGKAEQWACFPPGIQALNFIRGQKDLQVYKTQNENGKISVEL